ncbi:MAG TPA: methyl-accepting chemotaxis protein [Spirochaetia bacterium]|nr:methyl-accepting chemotaxis protein [Spirochaetia bacterium]
MSSAFDSLLKPFLRPYAEADIRIRKKARVLAPAAMTVGSLGLVLCAVMAATGAAAVAGILVGLALFCAFVLLLLARGRYGAASSLFMYGLFAVMFAAIKFDEYRNVYETYVFATLGLFLLVTAGVLGVSRLHAYVLSGLTLAAIAALYLLDALPLDGGAVTALAAQSLATSGVIVAAGGLFSAAVIRMQATLVDESLEFAELARRQYLLMSEAVASAQEAAFRIGKRLAEASGSLSAAAGSLRDTASDESAGLASLDETLASYADGETEVIGAQDRLRAALGAYSDKVLEAGASVSQMIRAVEEIGLAAGARQGGVQSLAALARDGEERIAEVARAVGGIVASTERMGEMNALIGGVASRTNLLGMNASIEAAHAGEAGKGFGVVAEEIRSLSEEAAEGSRTIAGILKETAEVVAGATRASGETSEFFSRMSEEIQRVASTLGDLLLKLREISAGTSGVSQAIEGFASLATQAGSAADDTGRALRDSAARSAASRGVAARMRQGAAEMAKACDALLSQASLLEQLGRENILRMEELKAKVEGMAKV